MTWVRRLVYKQTQAPTFNIRIADNMWKCALLLSVCYLGLAAAQELSEDVNPSHYPHGAFLKLHSYLIRPACYEGEEYKECKNPCVDESCDAMGSLIPGCKSPEKCEPGCACREGFYRRYNFLCIPKCYCPALKNTPECRN
ncbi:hypothetical protein HF086_014835 [Spodoptera exigua]|uniref:TIL domain-containing protein n=1 Tax=Spodoptera exigua TaxID=7107 RepID=A0A922S9B9_SPOEX|nr:hypothetical protein HF086_014835 [Spodoptera exigua]